MFGIQLLAVLVGGGVGRMAASSIMFGIQLLAVMVVVVVWEEWQQVVLCLEYSCWQ